MSIRVTCDNGHRFKVKEKYSGKTGKCPKCKARVEVPVVVGSYTRDNSSVLDDDAHEAGHEHSGSGISLIGSRVNNTEPCPRCEKLVPIWHCKCDDCGHRFAGR